MMFAIFGGLFGGLALAIWWLFFSRDSRVNRWGAIFLMIASLFITSFFIDESIAKANMGLMFIIHSIPVMSVAFVSWSVITRHLKPFTRRITMIATILVASGLWIFIRTNGMTGDARQYLGWRWAKTSEEKLLAQSGSDTINNIISESNMPASPVWPGFRGPERNGIVRGVRINPGWASSLPVEMWRKPVGPGCGSFAVMGNFFYTQEQRGEYEEVSCYNIVTGNPVWKHSDRARFYEPHAGAGPRSTPSISGRLVFTLGSTGILNALNAGDGKVKWSKNAAADAGVKEPGWGFSGSPLVIGTVVIASISGKLAAYDTLDGKPRWYGPDGGSSYSSPQVFSISGIPQIVFMSDSGAISLEPESGTTLWEYKWKSEGRILQPSSIIEGDFLITGENKSIRRVSISNENGKWKIKDLWNSFEIKAYFNDFVVSKGYAYGFDGPTMTCIDLKDGKRMWRGSRYRGFQVLIADQDLIVVLTEKGELALVSSNPEKFQELSRFQALKGKTWSHPVIAGNILLVRNAQEMAAFRLN